MNVLGIGNYTNCSNFCAGAGNISKKIKPVEIIVPDSITFKLPVRHQPENRLPAYEIPPDYFPTKPSQGQERGTNIEPMNRDSYLIIDSIVDNGSVNFPTLKM